MWSHTSFKRSRSWLTISSVCRKRRRCSVSHSMRLEVEMVRGLVEDQEVGIAEQRAGQRHAHAPAAGEFAAGPALRRVVEAQPVQDRGGPRRRRGGTDLVEPGMDLGQPQAVVAGLVLGQQGGALDVGRQHGIQHRDVAAGRILRDRADAHAAGHVDVAAVGLDHALDQAQQRRFARAIAADQADLPAVGNGRRGAIEQDALAVAEGKVVDVQHGAAAFSTRKGLRSNRLAGAEPRVYKARPRAESTR